MVEKESIRWMMETIPDAAIVVDEHHHIALVNARLCQMFGYEADQLLDADLALLIPEPLRQDHSGYVGNYFTRSTPRPMGNGLHFFGRRADGDIFPVDIMLNGMELEGRAMVMAIVRDNTDRVGLESLKLDLQRANARLEKALDLGRMGWWEARLDERTLLWSGAMRKLLGLSDDVSPDFDVVRERAHPQDRNRLITGFEFLDQVKQHRSEYRLVSGTNDTRWVEEVVEVSRQVPHQRVALGVIRDITAQKVLEQKLMRESVTDGLTGFFNRRRFEQALKERFAEYLRNGSLLALIIYDFDFFKNLNDQYGHPAGDLVLRESSAQVQAQLRVSDSAYRIGGEEFAILLPATSKLDAVAIAERLRLAVAGHRFKFGSRELEVSITAGVAVVEPGDLSCEAIHRRADEALYRGKRQSRNQVCY